VVVDRVRFLRHARLLEVCVGRAERRAVRRNDDAVVVRPGENQALLKEPNDRSFRGGTRSKEEFLDGTPRLGRTLARRRSQLNDELIDVDVAPLHALGEDGADIVQ
jgi:hypothetical protein